MFLIN